MELHRKPVITIHKLPEKETGSIQFSGT